MAWLSWRGSFVILGGCSLVWVTVWAAYFRDHPAEHAQITTEELDRLPNAASH